MVWLVGREVPALVRLCVETKGGVWQPLAAAMLALGFVVAPVATLELGKALIARLPFGGGKK